MKVDRCKIEDTAAETFMSSYFINDEKKWGIVIVFWEKRIS